MATPGFNEDHYLAQKLESLQTQGITQSDGTAYSSVDEVKTAIEAAGLTPESHYEQIGFNEEIVNSDGSTTKLTPNEFFNAEEYIAAKANQLLELDPAEYGPTIADAKQSFLDALDGANPYEHYLQFGDAEGLNPSNSFDTEAYFESKLAALQADADSGFDANSTVADVKAAFAEAGLSAAAHYEAFGKEEGLSVTAVATANQVDLDAADRALTGEDDDISASANEVVEGVVSTVPGDNTLDAADRIDGAGTLSIDLGANFAGFDASGDTNAVTNVDTLDITNTSNIARTFDADDIEGVSTIRVDANDQNFTINNVNDATNGPVFEVSNADGATTFTITADTAFTETITSGDADSATITTFGVGTAETADAAATALSLNLDEIEELNLTASGSEESVLDLSTMNSLETLDINGSADVTILDGGTSLATVDAGDATGDVTIVSDNSEVTASFTGGSGSDTLEMNTAAAATTAYTMSSIETLDVTDVAGGTLTFVGTDVSGLETIAATTVAQDVLLTKMGSSNLAFDIDTDGSNTQTITSDHSGTSTIDVAPDTDLDAEAQTDDTSFALNDSSSVSLNVAENMTYSGTVTADSASSLTATIAGAVTGALTSADAETVTVSASGTGDSDLALTAGDATTLNLTTTSTGDLDVADGDTSSVVTLTGSAATGSVVTTGDLAALNTATLSGNGSVVLGNVGATDLTYGVDITASALAGGFTVGSIDTANSNSVTVDVSEVTGAATIGAVTAAGASSAITIEGSGVVGALGVGNLAANTVTLNADSIGAATFGTVDVGETFTFVGSSTNNNDLSDAGDITATGETFTAALTGGTGNDTFNIDAAAGNTTTDFTVTGDLGTGTNSIAIDAGNGATDADIDISGLTDYDSATLTGEAGDNTIVGGAGADTITGGAGVDTLTGGAGDDNFVYSADDDISADSTAGDQITDFVAADDTIQFEVFTNSAAASGFNDVLGGNTISFLNAGGTAGADFSAIGQSVLSAAGNSANFLSAVGVTDFYEFSGADLSGAIDAFETFLTQISNSGGAQTAFAAFAELDAGGDTYLAIAFVAENTPSAGIEAGDIDFRVIDVDGQAFTTADIEFLAAG